MNHRAAPPLVIGMPVYNATGQLAETIESLTTQTYGDFLLVIRDNASTDDTIAMARDLAEADPRIEVVPSDTNIGANRNYNEVARYALDRYRPRWFKWAAHDDLCLPTYLERCVGALEADARVVLAYPVTVHIDADGRPMSDIPDPGPIGTQADPVERFTEIINDQYGVFYIFGVMKADTLAGTALFGPHWPPDKALAAWLALEGPFVEIDEPLFLRRTHLAQSSSLDRRRAATWSGGRLRGMIPAPVWASIYLARAIRAASISPADRRRASRALARLYVDPDRWRRVVRPGRDNFLGWTGGGHEDEPNLRLPETARDREPET